MITFHNSQKRKKNEVNKILVYFYFVGPEVSTHLTCANIVYMNIKTRIPADVLQKCKLRRISWQLPER